MRQFRHMFVVLVLIGLFVTAAVVMGTPRSAQNVELTQTSGRALALAQGLSIGHAGLEPPLPAETDTCLHCHLSGSIENMWTPLARWSLASLGGLVFIFGVYRTGSAWVGRRPWKPLRVRALEWVDERYKIVEPLKKVLNKPVELFSTRWMYCLGGITFTLFVIQGITGMMLMFYYKPTPEAAYQSILFIENEVRFGAAIRAIHHWSANGMVLTVVAHMLRVFIHGAFKAPRELNWVSGIVLLITTLGFGLTGYLLPWDQRAYWATTVASEIAGGIPQIGDLILVFARGGWEVSAVTLSRFYALHVIALPALILLFLGVHFVMIRRQGIARPL